MPIITLSRQTGSLGTEIAALIAIQLDYRLIDRQLINQAAQQAGTPEAALAAIDELGLLGLRPSAKERCAYQQAVQRIMLELAEEGDIVFLGRGGQVILKGRKDTIHVRIIAPLELRISRIANAQKIDQECAKAQIDASDRYHVNYLRRCYGVRWDDPLLYDLIINTQNISPPVAAYVIRNTLLLHIQQSKPGASF
jgi:cytidylate kinase